MPQVGTGVPSFLGRPPDKKTPLSQNRIAVTETSLVYGWMRLDQCYQGLDAVPDAELVLRYRAMRCLQIMSTRKITWAIATQRSVKLRDVHRRIGDTGKAG